MKRILLAMLFVSLLLAVGLYISCGSASTSDDDDASPSDDDACSICQTTSECTAAFGAGWACQNDCCVNVSGSDDDTMNATCQSLWNQMYAASPSGCGLAFYKNGVEVSLNTVIADCEADKTPYALTGPCAACVENNPPPNDCTGMSTCLQACANASR